MIPSLRDELTGASRPELPPFVLLLPRGWVSVEPTREAFSSRPVCPRLARLMTARIIVVMAPAVSAWMPALRGTSAPVSVNPSRKSPAGTQA